jgi:hypothetical protein
MQLTASSYEFDACKAVVGSESYARVTGDDEANWNPDSGG